MTLVSAVLTAASSAKTLASPAIAASSATIAGLATTYAVPLAGFGAAGVAKVSVAAGIQSLCYGAVVPAGSLFATFQSMGATGAAITVLGIPAGVPVAGAVGMGVWYILGR